MGRGNSKEVIAPCQLCLETTKLLKSHIIPEFVWKPIYDEKHRIFSVNTATHLKSKMIQKGIYEKLLCQKCETKLSKLEHYASIIMNQQICKPTFDPKKRILTFQNVDYTKFKLFQLSILWKASVAKDANFEKVSLGPHEQVIRKMLLNDDPGKPYQYGCVMCGLNSRAGIPMDRVIVGPLMKRKLKHVTYTFVFARCQWNFVVSSHSIQLKGEGIFLQDNGELKVAIRDAEDLGLLDYIYRTFEEAGVLNN